jgi:hypothetical protein
MLSETQDPWFLTLGPLITSFSIKQAMLHDWGTCDAAPPFGEGFPNHQRQAGQKS